MVTEISRLAWREPEILQRALILGSFSSTQQKTRRSGFSDLRRAQRSKVDQTLAATSAYSSIWSKFM